MEREEKACANKSVSSFHYITIQKKKKLITTSTIFQSTVVCNYAHFPVKGSPCLRGAKLEINVLRSSENSLRNIQNIC